MKKILFFPGTFNPPHLGHASVVKVAVDNIKFDEIWIMPSGKRVDKEIPTSLEDRKNMSSIFVTYLQSIINVPIKLITIGVDNTDDKYTHEHIEELKAQSEDKIFQLVGIDGYLGIKERIIGPEEKFVINKRSGYEIPEGLISNHNLIFLDEAVGVEGISSTKIREMVKNGDPSYKELVPKEIGEYIEKENLYVS
jgi:nicotinate-nucleotide adenylyltransferase